jgi:probable HAF family extracellular repeat protein
MLTFWLALQTGTAAAQGTVPRYIAADLGDLGGGEARATSINAAGQVVGFSYLASYILGDGCAERRAFLYVDGVMTALPSLPGTRFAVSGEINDEGDVAGTNYVYAENSRLPRRMLPGSCESQTLRSSLAARRSTPGPPWYPA